MSNYKKVKLIHKHNDRHVLGKFIQFNSDGTIIFIIDNTGEVKEYGRKDYIIKFIDEDTIKL